MIATAFVAAASAQADARMTVVYDLTDSVNELTSSAQPNSLDPALDGLYQQSIARRGDEFPGGGANERDGDRFVAKIVGGGPALPSPGNCSNAWLADAAGTPLPAGAVEDLLRDGNN